MSDPGLEPSSIPNETGVSIAEAEDPNRPKRVMGFRDLLLFYVVTGISLRWIATAAAALSWMFAEWVVKGKPSVLGIASGAVAGLVAITPASGFVGPAPAVIIGIVAGVVCFLAATSLKSALGYDDSLDAFGVHCIGGIIGALLTGVFASKEISGADGSVIIQLWGVGTTLIYGFVMSFIILKIIDMTIGLRVTEEQEREGLDLSLHGERVE